MDHLVTVRDIVIPLAVILGTLAGLGLIAFILSFFADAWRH